MLVVLNIVWKVTFTLQLSKRETTAGADTAVVLDGYNGQQFWQSAFGEE